MMRANVHCIGKIGRGIVDGLGGPLK